MTTFKRTNLASTENPIYVYEATVDGYFSGINFSKVRISKMGNTWTTTILPADSYKFIQSDYEAPTKKYAIEEIGFYFT